MKRQSMSKIKMEDERASTDADYTLTGEGDYDYLGYSVAFAGNYDGDA